ncbi:hypothetical protein ACLB2K_036968 [Fragaria x ananassa]
MDHANSSRLVSWSFGSGTTASLALESSFLLDLICRICPYACHRRYQNKPQPLNPPSKAAVESWHRSVSFARMLLRRSLQQVLERALGTGIGDAGVEL